MSVCLSVSALPLFLLSLVLWVIPLDTGAYVALALQVFEYHHWFLIYFLYVLWIGFCSSIVTDSSAVRNLPTSCSFSSLHFFLSAGD